MPVDYTGTKPGLPVPTPEEPKYVHMRCKNDGCHSMRVTEVTPMGIPGGAHLYQCVECKMTWGIAVGGGVSL
jgi:hypothetical protein